jgi:hypothetical protein
MGWLKKVLGKGGASFSAGAKLLGVDDDINEYSMSKQLFGAPPKSDSKTPYADMLAGIQEEQRAMYESMYRPVAQGLIKDVNSTKLVDTAKASAAVDRTEADQARAQRQRLRLGMNVSSSDQALADYSVGLNRSLTNEGNINASRVAQEERNQGVRNELINVSRGIATSAMSSAVNAAQAEGSRNSANAQLAANNDAAKTQTMTSVASMALMALMMM